MIDLKNGVPRWKTVVHKGDTYVTTEDETALIAGPIAPETAAYIVAAPKLIHFLITGFPQGSPAHLDVKNIIERLGFTLDPWPSR